VLSLTAFLLAPFCGERAFIFFATDTTCTGIIHRSFLTDVIVTLHLLPNPSVASTLHRYAPPLISAGPGVDRSLCNTSKVKRPTARPAIWLQMPSTLISRVRSLWHSCSIELLLARYCCLRAHLSSSLPSSSNRFFLENFNPLFPFGISAQAQKPVLPLSVPLPRHLLLCLPLKNPLSAVFEIHFFSLNILPAIQQDDSPALKGRCPTLTPPLPDPFFLSSVEVNFSPNCRRALPAFHLRIFGSNSPTLVAIPHCSNTVVFRTL